MISLVRGARKASLAQRDIRPIVPFHTSNVRAADLHTVFDFYGVQFWCVGKSNYMCFCQQCWWCVGPEGRGWGAAPPGDLTDIGVFDT